MAVSENRRALLLAALLLVSSLATSALAAEPKPADMPLRRVVLFTSGVGFFEHGGKVQGNATVDLKFNVDDVNDLLKSMVLEDQGGGKISTVTYDSRDPITKTLRTFSVDLSREPTLAELLRQIRGEQIRLEVQPTFRGLNLSEVTGQIIGVESRQHSDAKGETTAVDVINVLTSKGLRSIPLDSVTEFRLLSEKLNTELQEALGVLAQRHGREKKTITLKFLGAGERPVRVGYIQESPVWKTSYRLVLKDEGAPLLQGWAIVENTTEHDWQDVQLTLVNGRPISFKMDLYQPLYVLRPEVAPETFGTLRPQLHHQDLAAREGQFLRAGLPPKMPGMNGMGGMGGMGGGMGGMGGGTFGAAAAKKQQAGGEFGQTPQEPLDPGASVRSAAQGDDVGELFRYQIETPVTMVRQQSAMLPIVNDGVKAEKVSLFNPEVQASHPLNAVQLNNSTKLHLMQGPITVFDGGEYAGDARIEDLAPGSRRLISYALDLDTEISQQTKSALGEMVSAKVASGVMHLKYRQRRSRTYTIKNSGSRAKKVLIEQPVDQDWALVTKAAEQTRSLYRFEATAEPGKPAKLAVEEDKTIEEHAAFAVFSGEDQAAVYLKSAVISPAIKQAIEEVIRRRKSLADLTSQRLRLDDEVDVVVEEQGRIRMNMAQLDRTSELYTRYVRKFADQESQIEKLRPIIKKLAEEESKARLGLDSFIEKLNLD